MNTPTYINNDFVAYFQDPFKPQFRKYLQGRTNWLWKILAAVGAVVTRIFQLGGHLIRNAGVELLMVILFSRVVFKMSQGRDLVVSMFEPDALYSEQRILFTIAALLAFSVSMWIIPAALFEYKNRFITSRAVKDPFKDHLFFAHRILALIPFWTMAYGLFNDQGWLFILLAIAEATLFTLIFALVRKNQRTQLIVFFVVLGLLIVFSIYFFQIFGQEYLLAKRMLAVVLYLLSAIVFMLYLKFDFEILNEHFSNTVKRIRNKYPINTTIYIACFVIHLVLVIVFIKYVFELEIAPESMILYVFAVYVFLIDMIYYIVNLNSRVKSLFNILVAVVVILLFYDVLNFNTHHYTVDRTEMAPKVPQDKLLTLDNYYDQWKQNITDSTKTYPIILVAGEGGGSRGGYWFSQNLIRFDSATRGNFRKHIFSISTVSGSTVGLGTYFAYLDLPTGSGGSSAVIPGSYSSIPEHVYATNFVGKSISGLFFADLFHALWPFKHAYDRNNVLMAQESEANRRAIARVLGKDTSAIGNTPLDEEYLSVFYRLGDSVRFRSDHPLALINTTRSNDGRRGIYAPIKLDENIFNDAVDVVNYLYTDTLWPHIAKKAGVPLNKRGIKFGVACVSSELFPILSAPLYVDSLGSFVDGGYHENSGLKTTLEVYAYLMKKIANDSFMRNRKFHVYILYLKNGGTDTETEKPKPSILPIIQPLKTLLGQPFNGSASYFEKRAQYIDTSVKTVSFIKVPLESKMLNTINYADFAAREDASDGWKRMDSATKVRIQREILNDLRRKDDNGDKDTILSFPLARWLSHSVIQQMKNNQRRAMSDSTNAISRLLTEINDLHK